MTRLVRSPRRMVLRCETQAVSAAQHGPVSRPQAQPDLHLCGSRRLLGRHGARPVQTHIRARQQRDKQLGCHGGRAGLLLPEAGRGWAIRARGQADSHDRAHRELGLRQKEYVTPDRFEDVWEG
jgi:hypothetical protein